MDQFYETIRQYMLSHDMVKRRAAKHSLNRITIMTKSNAALERDFKCMNNIRRSAGPRLSDDTLDFRLRILLNCPKVLDGGPEVDRLLDRIVAEMMK